MAPTLQTHTHTSYITTSNPPNSKLTHISYKLQHSCTAVAALYATPHCSGTPLNYESTLLSSTYASPESCTAVASSYASRQRSGTPLNEFRGVPGGVRGCRPRWHTRLPQLCSSVEVRHLPAQRHTPELRAPSWIPRTHLRRAAQLWQTHMPPPSTATHPLIVF